MGLGFSGSHLSDQSFKCGGRLSPRGSFLWDGGGRRGGFGPFELERPQLEGPQEVVPTHSRFRGQDSPAPFLRHHLKGRGGRLRLKGGGGGLCLEGDGG